MALDRPYPKKTHSVYREVSAGLEPSGGLEGVVVTKIPGKGLLRMKPWKQRRHGARLKGWMLTGTGGGASRMSYAPEQ
jgi:hypothetical protein